MNSKIAAFFKSQKLQLGLIVFLTLISFINIFQNQFVIDDKTFIVNWEEKNNLLNIPKFFAGVIPEGHEGVYRPLRSVLYSLYFQIFKTNPFGYHLHSIIVHLLSTILIYFITRQIVISSWFIVHSKDTKLLATNYQLPTINYLPFVTALLFGLHPIHTETITYISSSMDTTGIVFMLASFYFYITRNRKIVSIILAVLAFFTFEVTLVLPLLIVLYDLTIQKISFRKIKEKVNVYFPYFFAAAAYLAIRFFLIHAGSRGPYLGDSIYLTAITMAKVFIKYISLTIFPLNLANNHVISKGIEAFVYRDYRTEAIKAQSLLNPDILISIIFIIIIIFIAVKAWKKYPLITFSIGWFFISLLPVSEIIPQGSMLNERFLYLPSFGFVLLLGWGLGKLGELGKFDKNKLVTGYLLLVTLIASFYGVRTYLRNQDWYDNISLWSKDIKIYPNDNAYAYFQLGNAYFEQEKAEQAIQNYQKSYEINPGFGIAIASIARVYENLGFKDKAIEYYKATLEKNPTVWEARAKLADLYTKQAEFDLARSELNTLISKYPDISQFREMLENLPQLKDVSEAGNIKEDNTWIRIRNAGGLSLNYPSNWDADINSSGINLTSGSNFKAEIKLETKADNISPDEYFSKQTNSFPKLENQGKALVPGYDPAYVKVYDGSGIKKLEFFLFKGNRVLKVLVYPPDSEDMRVFEQVLGSVKIN